MEQRLQHDLGARLTRLESSIRRDRTIALSVVALIFVTAQAPGPSNPTSVSHAPIVVRDASGASATLAANGLTVRDAAGKARTFIGIDSDGRPSADLNDSTGQLRESMYLLNQLPVFRQFDAAGKRRLEMRLDTSQDGELLLNDQSEKLRAALFRTSKGDPQLGLYGSDEKLRGFFSTDDDSPYLVMKDNAGTTRLYAGGYTGGSIGFDVRDAQNNVLWKAP